MGPTNVSLVNLFKADQALRGAQERLDLATKNVRLQQRRVTDLQEKLKQAQLHLREYQAKSGQVDLELRTRDQHIERLRSQQQSARNNKEYQAFLIEINTHKTDRGKLEEEGVKLLEVLEAAQAEVKALTESVGTESIKLTEVQSTIGDQTKLLRDEVERLKGPRDEAANTLPPKAREAFTRLADRYDGEALSKLIRPDRRLEEYFCDACQMDLVRDVYNRLHARDELVICVSCGRLLYIPDELPPEAAVNKPKPQKKTGKMRDKDVPAAGVGRQLSAADVLRSVQVQEDEPEAAAEAGSGNSPSVDAE